MAFNCSPPPDTDPLNDDLSCDVVIIGAGFTGLRTALELSRASLNVIVLEKNIIGYGASGRSGGQVNLGFKRDPHDIKRLFGPEMGLRMLRATSNASDELFSLIRQYGLNCDPVQKGWLKASHCKVALDRQKKQQEQWAHEGVDLEFLNAQDILSKTGANGYVGGLLYSKGGSIQPLSFTRELARVCQDNGVLIFENSSALSVQETAQGVKIKSEHGSVKSDKVVICTNGYTDNAWSRLKETIVPVRSIQAATEPLPTELREGILPAGNTLSDMRRIIYYFRMDRDFRLCFGGVGPMRDRLCKSDFASLLVGAHRVFPALKNIKWEYFWGGRLGVTRDSLPHIHTFSPRVYAGLGFNGRGVGLGVMMGRVLSEVILERDANDLDFPITSPQYFSCHKFTKLGFHMAKSWYGLLDSIDLIRG